MIEFFSAILGFGAPFLPELLKYFKYANEFKRHDPLVIGLGASLGVTDTELDNLFNLAATL